MADQVEAQAFQMRVLDKLKKSKFQDSLRSIMRLKMIEKLKDRGDIFRHKDQKPMNLAQKLAFSMFNNLLEKQNMSMTQSILLEELGDERGLLSDRLSAETFQKSRPKMSKDLFGEKKGFEETPLIEQIISFLLNPEQEEGVDEQKGGEQGKENGIGDMNIEQKLMMIEDMHQRNKVKVNNAQTYEKLLREMERRYKTDLEMEITRVREVETNAAKAEEAKKWQLRFEKFRDELEGGFNKRLDSLKDRELKMLETYQSKVRELEDRIHGQREDLRMKGDQLQRELEYQRMNNDFDKNSNKDKLKELERREMDLHKKMREVDNKEKIYQERLEREMEIYRTVTMKELRQKKLLVETKLQKLNEELDRVKGMRKRVEQLAERNKNLELEIGQKNEVRISGVLTLSRK